MDRVILELKGEEPGPLVICIGGLHGNEHQGVDAIMRIRRGLESQNISVNGHIVGLIGNQQALQANQRFLDYDLNRCWTDAHINAIKSGEKFGAEDLELLSLHKLINEVSDGINYTSRVIVDLHTTSSEKGNFIVVPEEREGARVINSLHLPVVIDLDKYLEGTLLQYFNKQGFTSFAFEGGMIGSDEAIDLHTSGIWQVLSAAGAIDRHDHIEENYYKRKLKAFAADLPNTVRAFYRHWVEETDDFEMNPGYFNFKQVKKGEELAKDNKGPILAPRDSMIFMPLYQKSGNDGFFLVDEVPNKL